MRVAIVSQGEELLTGETVDTNSAWLADRCWALGGPVRRMVTAGDQVADICWALGAAADVADLVICTGGLGPTGDDLTAEAVAAWMSCPLHTDPEAMAQVAARFAAWGRPMSPSNRKQAQVPVGATVLENLWGTAPGFSVSAQLCEVVCLPGIPSEMREMFAAHVEPLIARLRADAPPTLHRIRTIGIGESRLQDRLSDVDIGTAVLGFRSHLPEVQVKLRFPAVVPESERADVVRRVVAAIGRGVYNVDGGDLAEELGIRLVAGGHTIALAESCTAGGLAAWLATVPGSSRYLLEGAVVYSNEAKIRACGVPDATISQHGAVSEPVARALALGIQARAGTTLGVGITGVAGPGGGSDENPVGTVHIAVAGPDRVEHHRFRLPGGRQQVTRRAAGLAINMVLEMLTPSP
jgi:nicotinamide-nucleotide amidase